MNLTQGPTFFLQNRAPTDFSRTAALRRRNGRGPSRAHQSEAATGARPSKATGCSRRRLPAPAFQKTSGRLAEPQTAERRLGAVRLRFGSGQETGTASLCGRQLNTACGEACLADVISSYFGPVRMKILLDIPVIDRFFRDRLHAQSPCHQRRMGAGVESKIMPAGP